MTTVAIMAALASLSARAAASDLVLDHLAPGTIKLDGKVNEWPGTTPATVVVRGKKSAVTFAIGYDDAGLWVGADVPKTTPAARSSGGQGDDCVGVVIAFPNPGVAIRAEVLAAHEVGLFPGTPGVRAGMVKMRAGPLAGTIVSGAQIVEAPRKGGGFSLEAFVPWGAFPEARRTRVGMRGALRAYDGDGTSVRSIQATGAGTVEATDALDRFLTEPEQSLPAAVQTRRDIGFTVTADLLGDPLHERALFAGRLLYLLGPTFRHGKQWLVQDLGADVSGVEARDVTGDGHADLLVTTRKTAAGTTREALTVYTMVGPRGSETPTKVFAHETLVAGAAGKALRDVVSFGGTSARPTIFVRYEPAKGWDAATFGEPIASDVDPILLPWGAVRERSYVFSGGTFTKEREVAQAAVRAPASIASIASKSPASAGATPSGPSSPPVTPPAPGDAIAAAFRQFRNDRQTPSDVGARFPQPLRLGRGASGGVALFGRDLVVANGGSSAGGAYAFVTMSRFSSDRDVADVSVKDVTGDGLDEVIVRGILRAKWVSAAGEREVSREIVLVYTPRGSGGSGSRAGVVTLVSVFGAEVARSMGDNRVETTLRFGPQGRIELAAGSAKGWRSATYPFASEPALPGIEPLVLPWATATVVRYGWDGERFVARPL